MAKRRKTREQKIIAELRRKLTLRQAQGKLLRQAPTSATASADKQGESLRQDFDDELSRIAPASATGQQTPPLEEKTALPSSQRTRGEALKIPTQVERKSIATYLSGNYSYLIGDLKRVGILTGLAILAQGVLYWLLR